MARADPLGHAAWWEIRRAHNLKPATYRCPLCGQKLPALTEHMLMLPEGRPAGRRHAHTACVVAARKAGRLPTRAEWRRAQRAAAGGVGGVGGVGGIGGVGGAGFLGALRSWLERRGRGR
jgi:hypothetical protein